MSATTRLRSVAAVLTSRRDRLPAWADRALDRVKWARPPWARDPAPPPAPTSPDGRPARVLIAPANFAGQGWQWARALDRSGVPAAAWQRPANAVFGYPSDHSVPMGVAHRASRRWQRRVCDTVVSTVDAVVLEAGRPVLGRLHGFDPVREADALLAAGVTVALLWHGTDIRSPEEHARTHAESPYRLPTAARHAAALGAVARRNRRRLTGFAGPVLVSTPDLLLTLPDAHWCPVVVDLERWRSDVPVLERDVPVVVHVPSNPVVKRSDLVEPVLRRMEDAGLLRYVRAEGLPADELRRLYLDSDVVLDQFGLGIYGVAACEAMAAGRLVVSSVDPEVRALVRERAGTELPVLQASGAELETVLRGVLAERDRGRRLAAAGPGFVAAVHDGRRSAQALRSALRLDPR